MRGVYQAVVRATALPAALLLHLRYRGIHNIPKDGPFIVCSNHQCVADPYFIAIAFRQHLYFMAKSELFTEHGRAAAGFLRAAGAFPVHRAAADRQSLHTALKILQHGGCLGIFPQGKVVFENESFRPKAGAALLAARAGVPVVPVSIWCAAPWKFGKKTTVRIGPPLAAECFAGADRSRGRLRQSIALLAEAINHQLEMGH
ncbi:MAG: 1-acyl-sn-glycerol-3-phosphate acyltransferase [Oscillospiraceae bacterium]|jgi:1-acyl-sn-glycerol-3-phosphate acyltransferase|nr:1-acyl-sn-glycerol-3-phosphate acyltransferase [Oscillospiraceae bacterium]